MRPKVPGNDPPPWAKQIRRLGSRSRTPPKIIDAIAIADSVGMPISHGSQYFRIRSGASMSHGWTKTAAPRLGGCEEREELRGVEIPFPDVRADLDSRKPQVTNAPGELGDGKSQQELRGAAPSTSSR